MIKVSVLYPKSDDTTFDMKYFCDRHIGMVKEKLGDSCKKVAIEEGLSGGMPGTEATYVAMGHLYFDSVEDFQSAFGPHAETIMADIPNYTNVQPVIQISEVKV